MRITMKFYLLIVCTFAATKKFNSSTHHAIGIVTVFELMSRWARHTSQPRTIAARDVQLISRKRARKSAKKYAVCAYPGKNLCGYTKFEFELKRREREKNEIPCEWMRLLRSQVVLRLLLFFLISNFNVCVCVVCECATHSNESVS